MKSRAVNQESKNLKKEKFQDKALELLSIGQFPLPSVNQIIQASDEAKGTFYLYFKSKEEVYMEILSKEFETFYTDFVAELGNTEHMSIAIANSFIDFANTKPKIIYLATITSLILESNLNKDYLLKFKKSLWDITHNISSLISNHTKLDFETSKNNFLISYSLFLSMWQHVNPPSQVQEIIQKNNLSGLLYDLNKEYSRIVTQIWKS